MAPPPVSAPLSVMLPAAPASRASAFPAVAMVELNKMFPAAVPVVSMSTAPPSVVAETKVTLSLVVVMSPAVLMPPVPVIDTAPSAVMSPVAAIVTVPDSLIVTTPLAEVVIPPVTTRWFQSERHRPQPLS